MSYTNSKSLGNYLASELLRVVKESDDFFKKFNEVNEITKTRLKLNDEQSLKLVRFCALALELYNCADRFFNTYPRLTNLEKQMSSLSKVFLSSKVNKKKIDDFVKDFQLEVVFTAHPTEVFPLSILKNINRIEVLIEKLATAKQPHRKHRYIQALRASLTSLWLTDEIYREKPSPEDEANRLFYVLESSLWKSSPYFFRKYYWEYKKSFDASPKIYPKIKFSSWVGGDRDGNPFVTADATYRIITKSRRKVLRLILLELYPLREEILIKSKQLELKKLYPKSFYPYKSLFVELVEQIQKSLKEEKTDNIIKLEKLILSRLELAYKLLCKDGAKRLADRRIRSLIDRVKTFSLAPLNLDLRQDSEVHTQILKEIKTLTKSKSPSVSQVKKIPLKKLSPLAKDFFETLALANQVKPCPFNCYIISMTRSYQDIQNLKDLLSFAGVSDIPIVPLFETPDDIRNALNILNEAKSVKKPLKQVMWGYSDSTKKGGRLASAWNLYQVQQEVIQKHPKLIHFHGRGGSLARGGGEPEKVFELMPAQIVKNHFRQTFQGEIIQDDFGLPMRAVQSLEDLFSLCVVNKFKDNPVEPELNQISKISQKSEMEFKKAFYSTNKLNDLFEKHSPVSIINTMNLGSRPAKRKSKKLGVSYRAIPWVFAWSQTRGMLPLWYGLHGLEEKILKLKPKSHFIKSFLNLITQGLERADDEVFKMYFPKSEFKIPENLKSLKKKLSVPKKDLSTKDRLGDFLHKKQTELLKSKTNNKTQQDIEKVTAQGIASYLGKSG